MFKGVFEAASKLLAGPSQLSMNPQITTLGTQIKENESHLERVSRQVEKEVRTSRSLRDEVNKSLDIFSQCATALGKEAPGQEEASGSQQETFLCSIFRLVTEVTQELQRERFSLQEKMEKNVVEPIRSFVYKDINAAKKKNKEHQSLCEKFDQVSMQKEDAKVNRNVTPEKRKEIEDTFEFLRKQSEESEHETLGILTDVSTSKDHIVGGAMIDLLNSQLEYHQKCIQIIEKEKLRISKLKETMKEKKIACVQKKEERASSSPAMLRAQNAIFGEELENVMKRRTETDSIPRAVRQMIEWTKKSGIKEEGIFRISATKRDVDQWVEAINLGKPLDPILTSQSNPHLVCSLIKLYLRDLPEPICTLSLYQPILDFIRAPQKGHDPSLLKKILLQLPKSHYSLLYEIIELSSQVTNQKQHNKMSVGNMATVIGPNIFRKPGSQPSYEDMQAIGDIFVYLVENKQKLF